MTRRVVGRGLVALLFGLALATRASAQISSGTVTGEVKDEQGLPVPGVTVTLVSEARGTRIAPVVTGTNGEFVVASLNPDTYTVEVALEGFRTFQRKGIVVTGGDRVSLGAVTLTVGTASETVTVAGESPMVQSQSGDRSYSISTEAVQAIAVNGLRANQNTLQIDGVTSVDTGNNGNGVTLTVDAVQEVKVMTTSYQAEYGRSAGAQISAVTKSGTQRFRGTVYADRRRDDLNANTWLNNARGLPKQKINQ